MRTLRPGLYGDYPLATVRLPQSGLYTQSPKGAGRPAGMHASLKIVNVTHGNYKQLVQKYNFDESQ